MELKKLIDTLKLTGGKLIIIDESGDPKVVLMSFQEFEDLAVSKISGELAKKLAKVEVINREITEAQVDDLREQVMAEETIRVEPLNNNIAELD